MKEKVFFEIAVVFSVMQFAAETLEIYMYFKFFWNLNTDEKNVPQ